MMWFLLYLLGGTVTTMRFVRKWPDNLLDDSGAWVVVFIFWWMVIPVYIVIKIGMTFHRFLKWYANVPEEVEDVDLEDEV